MLDFSKKRIQFKDAYKRPQWAVEATSKTDHAIHHSEGCSVIPFFNEKRTTNRALGILYSQRILNESLVTGSAHRVRKLERFRMKNVALFNSKLSHSIHYFKRKVLLESAQRVPFIKFIQPWIIEPSDGGPSVPSVSNLMYTPDEEDNEVTRAIQIQKQPLEPQICEVSSIMFGSSIAPKRKELDYTLSLPNNASWDEYYKHEMQAKWCRDHYKVLDVTVDQNASRYFQDTFVKPTETFDIESIRQSLKSGCMTPEAELATTRFQLPSNEFLDAIIFATSEFCSRPKHQSMVGAFSPQGLITFGVLMQEYLRDQISSEKGRFLSDEQVAIAPRLQDLINSPQRCKVYNMYLYRYIKIQKQLEIDSFRSPDDKFSRSSV